MIKIPIGFFGLVSVFCALLSIISKDLYFRIKIGKGYSGNGKFIEDTSQTIKTLFFYLSIIGWVIIWFSAFHLVLSFIFGDFGSYDSNGDWINYSSSLSA